MGSLVSRAMSFIIEMLWAMVSDCASRSSVRSTMVKGSSELLDCSEEPGLSAGGLAWITLKRGDEYEYIR